MNEAHCATNIAPARRGISTPRISANTQFTQLTFLLEPRSKSKIIISTLFLERLTRKTNKVFTLKNSTQI